jgi:nitrogen fixation protein FixH
MKGKVWYWPAGLVALLVAGVAANIVFMLVATRDPSFAVERDYYGKAIRWEEAMAQAERNSILGWSVTPRLAPIPGAGGLVRLEASVTDAAGVSLADAVVRVEAFHGARAAEVMEAELGREGGRHVATLPMARPGLWELRFRVERGNQAFTQVLTREVQPAP